MSVYDMQKAYGKDPYEMFLSGSLSLITIENPHAQTDKEQQNIGKQLKEMHHSNNDNTAWKQYSLPIYEKLLLATSRNKSALKNIRDNVEKLRKVKDKNGKPLLSKEFINMWNLFAPYAK